MGTKDKLIKRFKEQPKNFTWEELVRLFGIFGFSVDNKGKTSGSRILFINGDKRYFTHKPHPGSIIKECSMKQILDYLKNNGYIN